MAFALLVDPVPATRPAGTFGPTRRVDASAKEVSLLDLGVLRGDGCFETLAVVDRAAQEVDDHLDRLASSARLLELPDPNLDQWRAVVREAASLAPDTGEHTLKLVYTRGVEGADRPTGWAHLGPTPDHTRARRDGVSTVLLDRGYPRDIESDAPWLLVGAKTLSYATNMAALREARRRGADDAVFTSRDGWVLEGATSNVVIRRGGVYQTPPPESGLLHGTTQRAMFRVLADRGARTEYRDLRVSELMNADAAWLVSSLRYAAPIRAVDESPLAVDAEITSLVNESLAARRL
jgi:4-amino-4-deoxychorismate lyase